VKPLQGSPYILFLFSHYTVLVILLRLIYRCVPPWVDIVYAKLPITQTQIFSLHCPSFKHLTTSTHTYILNHKNKHLKSMHIFQVFIS